MVSALLVATVIVYAVLIQPILYCVWKHGVRGLLGWLVIQMFCLIRIVGALLEIHEEKTGEDVTATLIVANFGLSPLLLGVLGILHEARTARDPSMNTRIEWIKVFAFHGQVVLAIVLLITGVTKEISEKTTEATPHMKVGAVLLFGCNVVLSVWTWLSFNQVPRPHLPVWNDATLLLNAIVLVLPFILLRTLYGVIATFSTDSSFKNNLAAKVCLSVVPEMLLVAVLAAGGIMTRNLQAKRRMRPMEQGVPAESQEYTLVPPAV